MKREPCVSKPDSNRAPIASLMPEAKQEPKRSAPGDPVGDYPSTWGRPLRTQTTSDSLDWCDRDC